MDKRYRGAPNCWNRWRREIRKSIEQGSIACSSCGEPVPPDVPYTFDFSGDDETDTYTVICVECDSCRRTRWGRLGPEEEERERVARMRLEEWKRREKS